jgi:hypothetical protein
MGDRANVFVIDGPSNEEELVGVFLYTHFGGAELPQVVQTALARRDRWNDSAYLTRIIFCEMVQGYEREDSGFGISARIGDNGHLIISVDCKGKRISFCRPNHFQKTPLSKSVVVSWTFDEYIQLSEDAIRTAWITEEE